MNLFKTQPLNTNTQFSNHFKLVFHKVRNVEYFMKDVILPGISFSDIKMPTPFKQIPISGDHLNFDNLVCIMRVDEEFRAYEEIFNWMTGLTFPHEFEEYEEQNKKGKVADGTLIMVPSSNDIETKFPISFIFKDLFPISLGGIEFSPADDGSTILTTQVIFSYLGFVIKR